MSKQVTFELADSEDGDNNKNGTNQFETVFGTDYSVICKLVGALNYYNGFVLLGDFSSVMRKYFTNANLEENRWTCDRIEKKDFLMIYQARFIECCFRFSNIPYNHLIRGLMYLISKRTEFESEALIPDKLYIYYLEKVILTAFSENENFPKTEFDEIIQEIKNENPPDQAELDKLNSYIGKISKKNPYHNANETIDVPSNNWLSKLTRRDVVFGVSSVVITGAVISLTYILGSNTNSSYSNQRLAATSNLTTTVTTDALDSNDWRWWSTEALLISMAIYLTLQIGLIVVYCLYRKHKINLVQTQPSAQPPNIHCAKSTKRNHHKKESIAVSYRFKPIGINTREQDKAMSQSKTRTNTNTSRNTTNNSPIRSANSTNSSSRGKQKFEQELPRSIVTGKQPIQKDEEFSKTNGQQSGQSLAIKQTSTKRSKLVDRLSQIVNATLSPSKLKQWQLHE